MRTITLTTIADNLVAAIEQGLVAARQALPYAEHGDKVTAADFADASAMADQLVADLLWSALSAERLDRARDEMVADMTAAEAERYWRRQAAE